MGCGLCDRGRHGDGNVFIGGKGWRWIQNLWGMDGVKRHLRAVSSDPLFSGFAVDSLKESKKRRKNEKAREGTTLPLCLSYPFAAANVCCMWRRTVDVMKHAKFQVKSALGFGAPEAENDLLH